VGFHPGHAELALEHGVTHRYHPSVIVAPAGQIEGTDRKVHLPGHADHREGIPFQHLEKRYFEVGNLGFPVWRAFDSIVGMMICNDRRWPESYRVMGLQGVELIMLGYNTPTFNIYHPEPWHLRMFHNRLSVQAGAYQNSSWVVATAKAGEEDGHGLIAGSCIIAPTGEIMAQALSEDDEVIVFNCDLDLCTHYKSTVFAFEQHRRIEHYGLISAQTGIVPPEE
jgi:predicted amidohydrolase